MLNLLICLLAIAMTVGSGGPRRSRLAQYFETKAANLLMIFDLSTDSY